MPPTTTSDADGVSRAAPAKINLGLHVLRKRPDGYHAVETVLHRIGWADTVAAADADTLSMTCSDPSLPTGDDNLCMEAARKLAAACDVGRGARIHLEKVLPYGAGLGGGSSDAVATLRVLNALWGANASEDLLYRIATSIGSDVPFFLQDAPAAFATGRGEVLEPLTGEEGTYCLPYPVLVVVPDVQISTPDAYRRLTPSPKDRPDLPRLVRSNDLARWADALVNDFETPMASDEPQIAAARAMLRAQGAAYVSLSGSGAAVYGVFTDIGEARTASATAEEAGFACHLTDFT